MTRMRVLGAIALTALLAACGGGGDDGGTNYGSPAPMNYGGGENTGNPGTTPTVLVRTAVLTGSQEVPAVATAATAKGAVVVDIATRAVAGGVTYSGITPTLAHIHLAKPGVSGGVAVPLVAGGPGTMVIAAGSVLSQAQYDALLAGELYFNLHSAAYGSGEIRGQLTGQGGVVAALADLNGAQEVPSVTTAASGKGALVVDSTTREIIIAVETFSGIGTATLSHIHQGATGVSGGVAVPLDLASGIGTAPPGTILTQAQYDALLAGGLYFNVHSTAYGSGEIRGQIQVQTQTAAGLVPTLASIQANVFTPSCTGCHSGASAPLGLRLDAGFSLAGLVNAASAQDAAQTRLIPGDPNASLLVRKLEGTQTVGGRMPLGGPYLSQGTINVIRQWIVLGAPAS